MQTGGRRSQASRTEQSARNQARGLFWLSGALLIVVMAMTARYGWNSTPGEWIDKGTQAAINGLLDCAGALAAGMIGSWYAQRFRLAGIGILFVAAACFVYSYSAVVGFLSTNRETLAQSRENAIGLNAKFLDWSTDMVTKRIAEDKSAKTRQETLTAGIEAVGAQVKKQTEFLQSGQIAAADGQAATFARITGRSEADSRSWVISGSAILILAVQYGLLWGYGFQRQRVEPAAAAWKPQEVSMPFRGKDGSQTPVFRATPEQARADLEKLIITDEPIKTFSLLAERWGWPNNTTGRFLENLQRQGVIDIVSRGRGHPKAVVRPTAVKTPRSPAPIVSINGNGRVHA